jgi:hypothetical protein
MPIQHGNRVLIPEFTVLTNAGNLLQASSFAQILARIRFHCTKPFAQESSRETPSRNTDFPSLQTVGMVSIRQKATMLSQLSHSNYERIDIDCHDGRRLGRRLDFPVTMAGGGLQRLFVMRGLH